MQETNLEQIVVQLRQLTHDLSMLVIRLDEFEVAYQRERIVEADNNTEIQKTIEKLREVDKDGSATRAFLSKAMRPEELVAFYEATGVVLPTCCSRRLALEIANGLSDRK